MTAAHVTPLCAPVPLRLQRRRRVAAVAGRAVGRRRGVRGPGARSGRRSAIATAGRVACRTAAVVACRNCSNCCCCKITQLHCGSQDPKDCSQPPSLHPSPSPPQIGFEWDRIVLHRMLTKIISQPQADNKARRLPRLKVGGCGGWWRGQQLWLYWGAIALLGGQQPWLCCHHIRRRASCFLRLAQHNSRPACALLSTAMPAAHCLEALVLPPTRPCRSCCTTCRSRRRQGCTRATSAWSWTPRRRWGGCRTGRNRLPMS